MQPRLAQTIAQQIRTYIIDSQLTPGSRLPTETELMNTYVVSRSTIREAMKILQAANVVEIRHGLGSFVAMNTGVAKDPLGLEFSAEQGDLLKELMGVRLLIEPPIAGLAAEKRTDEDLNRMEEAIQKMKKTSEAGRDYNSFDYEFHIAVAECTHNSVLPRLFPVIYEAIETGYAQTVGVRGSVVNAIEHHGCILEAIRQGNKAAAEEAARKHILQTIQDIGCE